MDDREPMSIEHAKRVFDKLKSSPLDSPEAVARMRLLADRLKERLLTEPVGDSDAQKLLAAIRRWEERNKQH